MLSVLKLCQIGGVFMRSRTERYSENSHATKTRVTRTKRNEYLYDDGGRIA